MHPLSSKALHLSAAHVSGCAAWCSCAYCAANCLCDCSQVLAGAMSCIQVCIHCSAPLLHWLLHGSQVHITYSQTTTGHKGLAMREHQAQDWPVLPPRCITLQTLLHKVLRQRRPMHWVGTAGVHTERQLQSGSVYLHHCCTWLRVKPPFQQSTENQAEEGEWWQLIQHTVEGAAAACTSATWLLDLQELQLVTGALAFTVKGLPAWLFELQISIDHSQNHRLCG